MIKTFRHKGLKELFKNRRTAKIDRKLQGDIIEMLAALDQATVPQDMRVPGYDFHPLTDTNPVRYSVHVNGPWCITFEFDGEDAIRVDFENYH
jgi:toxin HigB-1